MRDSVWGIKQKIKVDRWHPLRVAYHICSMEKFQHKASALLLVMFQMHAQVNRKWYSVWNFLHSANQTVIISLIQQSII